MVHEEGGHSNFKILEWMKQEIYNALLEIGQKVKRSWIASHPLPWEYFRHQAARARPRHKADNRSRCVG